MKAADLDMIGVAWCGNACEWRRSDLRRAYNLIIQTWTEAGLEPTHLAAIAPGIGKNYGSFKAKRRLIEKVEPQDVEDIELAHTYKDYFHISFDAVLKASISRRRSLLAVTYMPALVGAAATRILERSVRDLIVISSCHYAYTLQLPKLYNPGGYAFGNGADIRNDWRPDELRYNIQNWLSDMTRDASLLSAGILRNVYPENYLSEPHLSARLGRTQTTLKQWIDADPTARGTLEPFSEILTRWTPPIQKIPQIREELYRAGRVYNRLVMRSGFRNAQGGMTPEPLYRPDLSAPWEAPEPIPEIYRADFWKDKDPSLTY